MKGKRKLQKKKIIKITQEGHIQLLHLFSELKYDQKSRRTTKISRNRVTTRTSLASERNENWE